MTPRLRLFLSAIIAFLFYALWAYWANSAPNIALETTLKSAFVQGLYSGFMTLGFTFLLENVASRFNGHYLSLVLITPFICSLHKQTKRNKVIFSAFDAGLIALANSSRKPRHLLWLTPLIPISIQSILVIGINWLNHTPNLWLTVTPSILFSAIYAYLYLLSFLSKNNARR